MQTPRGLFVNAAEILRNALDAYNPGREQSAFEKTRIPALRTDILDKAQKLTFPTPLSASAAAAETTLSFASFLLETATDHESFTSANLSILNRYIRARMSQPATEADKTGWEKLRGSSPDTATLSAALSTATGGIDRVIQELSELERASAQAAQATTAAEAVAAAEAIAEAKARAEAEARSAETAKAQAAHDATLASIQAAQAATAAQVAALSTGQAELKEDNVRLSGELDATKSKLVLRTGEATAAERQLQAFAAAVQQVQKRGGKGLVLKHTAEGHFAGWDVITGAPDSADGAAPADAASFGGTNGAGGATMYGAAADPMAEFKLRAPAESIQAYSAEYNRRKLENTMPDKAYAALVLTVTRREELGADTETGQAMTKALKTMFTNVVEERSWNSAVDTLVASLKAISGDELTDLITNIETKTASLSSEPSTPLTEEATRAELGSALSSRNSSAMYYAFRDDSLGKAFPALEFSTDATPQ